MKVLYTAEALATGDGRNGHARSSDGILDFDLAMPPELGGKGGATNPEQLFAAGFSACFHSALKRVAGEKVFARVKREPDEAIIKIVSGWPTRFDAKRAISLGFKVEKTFEEIIRVHVDDELAGKIAA